MITTELQNIDWNELADSFVLKPKDLKKFGRLIVMNITKRILEQETATGRPLDTNSITWRAQKLREGKPQLPLQYTGGLRNPDYYDIKVVNGDTVRIQLQASYRDIHLDLITISEETGKNYRDWFGISEHDKEIILDAIAEIVHDKFVEFFGVYIRNG